MSDLAALLASGQVKEVLLLSNPDSELGKKVLVAARERLRLSKVPCETCGGTGIAGFYSHTDDGTGEHLGDEPIRCDACNGSGGEWPAELVDAVEMVSLGLIPGEALAILDVVEAWMEAGE